MSTQLFDLKGRRALIAGSSKGIGFALARGLGAAGAEVVLNGRNGQTLDAARQTLVAEGIAAHASVFDVTQPDNVTAAIEHIESAVGPLDILINNAGMQFRTPLEDYPTDTWSTLMRTNLDSAFYVGQAAAKHMIKRAAGRIINICSVQSELGRPGIAPYAASKGALKMLTKGMAIDWAPHGLNVNAIGPGYFKTELNQALVDDPEFTAWLEKRTPARRWGNVEELVGAAVFLSSEASTFVNGHVLYVDGGITSSL